MTLYINFFGGPCSGKSTSAASVFVQLKKLGVSCELVTEVAKDFTWENRHDTLEIQPYVDSKQYRNLKRLSGKVDFVVTDSPVLKGQIYAKRYTNLPEEYYKMLRWYHYDLGDSYNILLKRSHDYSSIGRNQDEEEAMQIAEDFNCLMSYNLVSENIQSVETAVTGLVKKYL